MAVVFKSCGTVPIVFPGGITRECQDVKIYIDGRETDIDLKNIARKAKDVIIPTDNVILEYGSKSYYLGEFGRAIILCINQPATAHTAMDCHDIVSVVLDEFSRKKKQTWGVSGTSYSGRIEDLDKFSAVVLLLNDMTVHSALHISDGIFFSKMGHSPNYMVSDYSTIRDVYRADEIHCMFAENLCHGCRILRKPEELKYCGSCQWATYCGKTCQNASWPKHKSECKSLQNSNAQVEEAARNYASVCAQEIDTMLRGMGLKEEAIQWFKNIFAICNTENIPCTRLEEVDLLISNPDDEVQDLRISNKIHPEYPFFVARLRVPTMDALFEMSSALGFSTVLEGWTGKTKYPIFPNAMSKLEKKIYQIPLVIRCGPTSKTGHFYRKTWGDYVYEWNK